MCILQKYEPFLMLVIRFRFSVSPGIVCCAFILKNSFFPFLHLYISVNCLCLLGKCKCSCLFVVYRGCSLHIYIANALHEFWEVRHKAL